MSFGQKFKYICDTCVHPAGYHDILFENIYFIRDKILFFFGKYFFVCKCTPVCVHLHSVHMCAWYRTAVFPSPAFLPLWSSTIGFYCTLGTGGTCTTCTSTTRERLHTCLLLRVLTMSAIFFQLGPHFL